VRFLKRVLAGLLVLFSMQVATTQAQIELTWFICCSYQIERTELFGRWARQFEDLNPGVTINELHPDGKWWLLRCRKRH